MPSRNLLRLVATLVALHIVTVAPSGRFMNPASRASGWRRGWPFPVNTEDNMLNCGGAKNQWESQDGKCGVCGDTWQGPRDHEYGGIFTTGITTETLTAGGTLQVSVELTTNKLGWFEFRLCRHDYAPRAVSQTCLDKHLLKEAYLGSSRFKITANVIWVDLLLQLPAGLSCSQCVLQWKYQTGDVKDDCSDCAGKEQFYGCADIRVNAGPSSAPPPTPQTSSTPTQKPPVPTPPSTSPPPTTTTVQPTTSTDPYTTSIASMTTSTSEATSTPLATTATTAATTMMTTSIPVEECVATPEWSSTPGMDKWCRDNCALGNCPPSLCICDPSSIPPNWEDCTATDKWKDVAGMIKWCRYHCRTGDCPKERCVCKLSTTSPYPTTGDLISNSPSLSVNASVTTAPKVAVTPPVTVKLCRAVKAWANVAGMNRWCDGNCRCGFCPKELCECRMVAAPKPAL